MKYLPWIIGAVAGLWLVSSLVKSTSRSSSMAGPVGSAASFTIQPGNTEEGKVNPTGGFTVQPDPNGIGGGFAT